MLMQRKKASDRYQMVQVSMPPDCLAWWNSLPDGHKSGILCTLIREEIREEKEVAAKVREEGMKHGEN
jgi:hypothetical protein